MFYIKNTMQTKVVSMISEALWGVPGTSQGPPGTFQKLPVAPRTSQIISRDPQGATTDAQLHQRILKDPAKTTKNTNTEKPHIPRTKPPASKP